jgi:hypothetical protein
MLVMRTTRFAAAALLALCACKSTTASDANVEEDTFDANSLSKYASFSDGGANWVIQNGSLFGTGPANQSVLIRDGVSLTDGWVEAVSSTADDGGLVLRFKDAQNYYLLAFRDDAAPSPRGGLNLAVYHHTGSAYDQMWVKDVIWARGTAHTLRFEAAGGQLRVYFDGELQVELTTPGLGINDPAPYTGAGGVGVRNYGADNSWLSGFDAFRWHAVR